MAKFDRFQQLHRLFSSRKHPVPLSVVADTLECTEGSAKRLIHQLRDYWHAPIEYDRERNGWQYVAGESFELPGLWLTAAELQSLTALLHLIDGLGEGLLNDELQVVQAGIHKLIAARGIDPARFQERITFLPMAKRQLSQPVFSAVASALIAGRQLDIQYRDFGQRLSVRTVSPQCLVYYRENWFLHAWCHKRQSLRIFSVSRIARFEARAAQAIEIDKHQRDQDFAASFGIFAGETTHLAQLRFAPAIAHEIASQQWHPQQSGEWQGNAYLLTIPYSMDTELIMEILKYGSDVEVLAPAELRHRVQQRLAAALAVYPMPQSS